MTMKPMNSPATCAACPLSRRQFLGAATAATMGALTTLPGAALLGAAESKRKTRIHIVYALHGPKQEGPDWPNKGFDFIPVMRRIDSELARRCPEFEFVSSQASGAEQARKLVEEDKVAGNIDGYLVYQLNCWNQVVQTVVATGKPVLYADFQFGGSGGFLVYSSGLLRAGTPNLGFVASSRMSDVAAAVRCFEVVENGGSISDFVAATRRVRLERTPAAGDAACKPNAISCLSPDECLGRLKQARILALRDQNSGPGGEVLGIKIEYLPFAELNEAWQKADKDQAREVADKWEKEATRIEGVSRQTLESSAAMYLAEKALLKQHEANAITINCLGGFYGGHIHAYPCLGFHQLNNEGLVGGCECDVRSAATMVIGTTLTQGRPGYISDPVIDTSKRQIIYAHCVASNKVFGPTGPSNPFEILTHSEDRQGASVRSLLPAGYMTTSLEFEGSRKEILLHRARTVGNDPDDRACRTKLCAEPVGDIEKLFTLWDRWGWHRVTFYGDLKEPVCALAEAAGWKVIEEA
jgi:hypothetical protein